MGRSWTAGVPPACRPEAGGPSGIPDPTPTLPRRRGRESEAKPRAGGGYQAAGEPTSAAALAAARRLVIKIGSALLVDDDGEIRRAWLDALSDDVARCRGRQQELILVSSGAGPSLSPLKGGEGFVAAVGWDFITPRPAARRRVPAELPQSPLRGRRAPARPRRR